MQPAPDNSGLYFDMMRSASDKIGFQLEVIREPKVRTYSRLKKGSADLYASGEFRDYRSKFLFYFPNGLYRIEEYYGLTSSNIPQITSLSNLNKHNLTWAVELGSSWPLQAQEFGVKYHEVKNVSVKNAIKLIQGNRPFFFKVDRREFKEYLSINNLASLNDLRIRVHKNCCETKKAQLYTSFSRFSRYYKDRIPIIALLINTKVQSFITTWLV